VHGVTATTDLSNIAATLEAFIDDGTDLSANDNLGSVDKFYLTGIGAEVTLSATQANEKQVLLADGASSGTVTISGDVESDTVDLTGIATGIALAFDEDSITVADVATLQLTLSQAAALAAAGQTINGEGTLLLEGGIMGGEELNLTTLVGGDVQVSFVTPPLIAAGGTLILDLVSADELETHPDSAGSIILTGDLPDGVTIDISDVLTTFINSSLSFNEPGSDANGFAIGDFSVLIARPDQILGNAITGPGTLRLTDDVQASLAGLDEVTANIDLSYADLSMGLPLSGLVQGQTLTVQAVDFDDSNFNGGEGYIVLVGLENSSDGLFQGITANSVTLQTLGADLTFTGNRGMAQIQAEFGARVTMTAEKANGLTLFGDGGLTVTGDVDDAEILDLTNVSGYRGISFDNGDLNTITVGEGGLLKIRAAEFTAGHTTLNITGASVEVSNATPNTAYDFSRLTAITSTVVYATSGQIHPDSNFTGVSDIKLATGVTEMLAEQANGISFTGSAAGASVNISGSSGDQNLNGTSGNDTFDTGSGTDAVNISQGGSDELIFTTEANDMDITGFDVNSGAENDVINFGNLYLANINFRSFNTETGDPNVQFTDPITGLEDIYANSALNVETAFKQYGNFLNNMITNVVQDKMVFLIANTADTVVNIWYWQDAPASNDNRVQQTELTKIGSLLGLGSSDIQFFSSDSFL